MPQGEKKKKVGKKQNLKDRLMIAGIRRVAPVRHLSPDKANGSKKKKKK